MVVTTVTQSGESFETLHLQFRECLYHNLTQTSLLLKWNIPSAASGLIKDSTYTVGNLGMRHL